MKNLRQGYFVALLLVLMWVSILFLDGGAQFFMTAFHGFLAVMVLVWTWFGEVK